MVCKLCEEKEVEFWFGKWCKSCRRIKHYLNLYGDRVYEVLDNVLCRTEEKQTIKEAEEIKKEIKLKEHNLRSNKKRNKSIGDDSHIQK
tara:strand:+ start:5815 stop:6081 length:267 start_codon:yes stop_codon:yes gene_type:complete